MARERLDPIDFDKPGEFLSGITGLLITSSRIFPELNSLGPDFKPSTRVPFSYDLILGSKGNEYRITFGVIFTDEWTNHDYLPDTKWRIQYNGKDVFSMGGMVNTSDELHAADFKDRNKVEKYISEAFKRALGGPDTEVPFMDYESYSLASLKEDNQYFENMYLALMIHMKERGVTMPPILSKRDYIREPMCAGDIKKVDQVLSSVMAFEGRSKPFYIQAHMEAEIKEIKNHVLWEARKKDPWFPIEEAFPYSKFTKIDRGVSGSPPYNILVVENDLRNYGNFTKVVVNRLNNDGRFKGSNVITDVNLSACMQICEAGRIDMLLFDWTNPSHEEVLMVRHENPNPFYEMYNGKAQTVAGMDDEEGLVFSTPDGKLLNEERMKEESERVDIRNRWMDMIKDACESKGTVVPPSFIVRSTAEFQDIAKIVNQKLGRDIK